MSIKVMCEVGVIEINGEINPVGGPKIIVESDSTYNCQVTLIVDAQRYNVVAADLIKAVENAMNTRRM